MEAARKVREGGSPSPSRGSRALPGDYCLGVASQTRVANKMTPFRTTNPQLYAARVILDLKAKQPEKPSPPNPTRRVVKHNGQPEVGRPFLADRAGGGAMSGRLPRARYSDDRDCGPTAPLQRIPPVRIDPSLRSLSPSKPAWQSRT